MTSYEFNKNKLYYVRDILVTVHRIDSKYHVPLYETDVPHKIKSVTPKCIHASDGDYNVVTGVDIEFDDSSNIEIDVDIEDGEIIVSNFYQLVTDNMNKNIELLMEIDIYVNKKMFKAFIEDNNFEKLNEEDNNDFRVEKILNMKV